MFYFVLQCFKLYSPHRRPADKPPATQAKANKSNIASEAVICEKALGR